MKIYYLVYYLCNNSISYFMYSSRTIHSFNEIPYFNFKDQVKSLVKKEINEQSKDYILNVDETEYLEYLKDNFTLEPLKIHIETEIVEQPNTVKEKNYNPRFGREFEYIAYEFTVKYNYEGSAILFKVQPNPWTMTSYEIIVNKSNRTVSFKFKMSDKNVEKYNREKSNAYNSAFKNIENINKNVNEINTEILSEINNAFYRRKEELKKENDFFAAINIKVDEGTKSVFSVPSIKKKSLPQPSTSSKKEFLSEPTLPQEMYNDILKVIYDVGKSMERKPSLYQNKDEEQLRDLFITFLETRYVATTVTGETFNRGGKTDIIIKYANDGSNIFVAECKFWHGSAEFIKAISQLFDRYLTWRDSKTALILFAKNKDFTNILNTIKSDIKNHPYYIKEDGTHGESSFSYVFHLPQDKDKEVFFEVIVFHFDK